MKNKSFRAPFMRKMLLRCAVTEIVATVLYGGILFLGLMVGQSFRWQPSLLYYILQPVQNYVTLWAPLLWLIMVLTIICFYWSKTARYLEDVARASAALLAPDDEDIHLPQELHEIEVQMNKIKRTAQKNAQAAREAEQRKNDLVVNLAHDIRTPLSSVIGYLSLLEEAQDMPVEQRAKYTGIALDKAYRLEQLINEFFEIARFNLSTIVLAKGKINLSLMLSQMVDEFYPILTPQGKTAVVEAAENLVLFADGDKLSRVFNNLLKNAIAYSEPNSEILICAFSEGRNVRITFSNQGDPIPEQMLETIFERFFRLDVARSSQTGGAGLGLAIAKEIVVAHSGTIAARSNQQETVFTLCFPTQEETATVKPNQRPQQQIQSNRKR